MIIRFFDFDGCLFDSPIPETGKDVWSTFHGKPYPHIGWWGRVESMDLLVYDIKPFKQVHDIYLEGKNENTIDFILTSRLDKFEPIIMQLLKDNDIDIKYVLTKNKHEKGERIVQTIEWFSDKNITDVYFYDDRDKEIISAEAVKEQIEDMGINFHIVQIIN